MKNFKMLLALVLALAMVLCFAACTEKKGDDKGEETTAPSTEATDPSTEATEPSSEPIKPSTEGTEPSSEVNNPTTEGTEPSTEETEPSVEPSAPSTSYAYAIKVVDADGNPVVGAFVQLCNENNCRPKATDANGIAGYTESEAPTGNLKAQILVANGYNLPAESIVYLTDGQTEVTFVVTAA